MFKRKGGEKKRNSATNIPSEPASVTNAVQGGERVSKNEKERITDDSGHAKHGL